MSARKIPSIAGVPVSVGLTVIDPFTNAPKNPLSPAVLSVKLILELIFKFPDLTKRITFLDPRSIFWLIVWFPVILYH